MIVSKICLNLLLLQMIESGLSSARGQDFVIILRMEDCKGFHGECQRSFLKVVISTQQSCIPCVF